MKQILGKESEDFKAFGDIWKFYQAYYEPEDNEKYWDDFIKDADSICHKYPSMKCLRGILMAISNANEEVLNEKKNH